MRTSRHALTVGIVGSGAAWTWLVCRYSAAHRRGPRRGWLGRWVRWRGGPGQRATVIGRRNEACDCRTAVGATCAERHVVPDDSHRTATCIACRAYANG